MPPSPSGDTDPAGCRIFLPAPGPAPAELADIWPRLRGVMAQVRSRRRNEAAVQAQQRGILQNGCLRMASPFAPREDLCTRSWFHEQQFYYLFETDVPERYFWISGMVGRGYSLDAIWFPARRAALTQFGPSVDAGKLARFDWLRAQPPTKPEAGPATAETPRTVVVGFQHAMHMLWNELPALDRLAGRALPAGLDISVLCEPLGPLREMFPGLATRFYPIAPADIPRMNATHPMVIGLGAWTITEATQARVRRVAAQQIPAAEQTRIDRFGAAHGPIFWLSVKPPKRTVADQAAMLAALIAALSAAYPDAGFILDGASRPWDFPINPNYPPWFHSMLADMVAQSAAIIADVLAGLTPAMAPRIVALNGVSMCAEIGWGGIANFYVCHGGTMQNKIGWLHPIPGFIHSNRAFMETFRSMPSPVEGGARCIFASDTLVIDDDPAGYTPQDLLQKNQDYRFSSASRLIAEVLAAV